MLNDSSGGSAESEASEVTVTPAAPRPASVVTTGTPAAWRRNTWRNSVASTGADAHGRETMTVMGRPPIGGAAGRAEQACGVAGLKPRRGAVPDADGSG